MDEFDMELVGIPGFVAALQADEQREWLYSWGDEPCVWYEFSPTAEVMAHVSSMAEEPGLDSLRWRRRAIACLDDIALPVGVHTQLTLDGDVRIMVNGTWTAIVQRRPTSWNASAKGLRLAATIAERIQK